MFLACSRNTDPDHVAQESVKGWNLLILEVSDLLVELKLVNDFLHTRGDELEEFSMVFRHASHCAET